MADTPKFQLFGIPNDEAGIAFITTLRKHTNYARYRVKVRGNGARASVAKAEGLRPGAYDQDIPLAKAATLRVYIEDKSEGLAAWQEKRLLQQEIETLTRNVQDLQATQETLVERAQREFYRGRMAYRANTQQWLFQLPRWLRWCIKTFDPAKKYDELTKED